MNSASLPALAHAAFRALFVYDVADTIDLERLRTVRGEGVARAPLQLRREASSEFIQYPVAPLIVRLPDLERPGATMRAKIFDFGVVSIRITIPFAGTWEEFAALTRRERRDSRLEVLARSALDDVLAEISGALDDPHPALIEDYFILEVEQFDVPVTAQHLTGPLGPALAQLMLFEDRELVSSEQTEALRLAFSYYPDDLAVIQWDAAFVYDRAEGAEAVEDILEFANSQLVEFRTYDARLDEELDAIYRLEPGRRSRRFSRRRDRDRAEAVRFLLVDVLELTDRTTNALKIIGDAYYARLYRAVAGRLGLADWQRQIDAKLRSVSEVYRVLQDEAQTERSQTLEIIVIVLVAFEAILGVLALRH
ncbi:hypothetical protein WPS_03100 [Vulcanimicrobium alpinum]|uniref:DUF155 domain-containing protein n=1 Tax=Vulcanimicrobium alpinum TaxID=3016050 RepID=A0AAN1XTW2_UNVUL|nr:hypothetical protein [Vulcanimicrobium alpinum]BDE05034.1 hypothetical protein WPS_03100 [Vulcanimicrobium alpinum]